MFSKIRCLFYKSVCHNNCELGIVSVQLHNQYPLSVFDTKAPDVSLHSIWNYHVTFILVIWQWKIKDKWNTVADHQHLYTHTHTHTHICACVWVCVCVCAHVHAQREIIHSSVMSNTWLIRTFVIYYACQSASGTQLHTVVVLTVSEFQYHFHLTTVCLHYHFLLQDKSALSQDVTETTYKQYNIMTISQMDGWTNGWRKKDRWKKTEPWTGIKVSFNRCTWRCVCMQPQKHQYQTRWVYFVLYLCKNDKHNNRC